MFEQLLGLILFLLFFIVVDLIFSNYKAEDKFRIYLAIEELLPSAKINYDYVLTEDEIFNIKIHYQFTGNDIDEHLDRIFFNWNNVIYSVDAYYNLLVHDNEDRYDKEIDRIIQSLFHNYQRRLYGGLTVDVIFVIKDFVLNMKKFITRKVKR